ncbi:MAG TPA: ribosome silencing factor [Kiloniellales bacterium]|nr:ribosome silencing factor [Kiloniellales bacterium]
MRGTDTLTSATRAAARKKPQTRPQNRPNRASQGASAANRALLDLILETLDDTKAENVVVIDLADKSSIADFMVVASGRSSRQVITMADHLAERLKQRPGVVPSIEGKSQGDWVLIDAGDVIVHLFRPEVREFYGLEKMWALPHDESESAPLGSAATSRAQALYA